MLEKGVQIMLTGVSRVREGGSMKEVHVLEGFRKAEHSKKENNDTNQGVGRIQEH